MARFIKKRHALLSALIIICLTLAACGKADKPVEDITTTVAEESAARDDKANDKNGDNEEETTGLNEDEDDSEAEPEGGEVETESKVSQPTSTPAKPTEAPVETTTAAQQATTKPAEKTTEKYTPSQSQTQTQTQTGGNAEKLAREIVQQIITSSMSEFQKALAIHDWLTFNIDYDSTYTHYYVEETLTDRTGVCQGYALAFNMMAEMAGLDVNYVVGDAVNSAGRGGGHAWNQVKIDGVWYNVDVTWDDPTFSGKSPSDHTNNRYDYFLISDALMYKNHTPDTQWCQTYSCPSNYDKATVLKYAAASGLHGNAAFASNQDEFNAAALKFGNAGVTEYKLWYYDTTMTSDNMFTVVRGMMAKAPCPLSVGSSYAPVNGVTRYSIEIPVPNWNSIPVVTNSDEANALVESYIAQGIQNFSFRMETTDGQFGMGVTSVTTCCRTAEYNNGYSKLYYDVTY